MTLYDWLRQHKGLPRWAWLHGETGWVGAGLRESAAAEGPERFRALQAAFPVGESAPRFVGFGFSPQDHHRAPWWEAFPAALLAAPESVRGPLAVPSEEGIPAASPAELPPAEEVLSQKAWEVAVQTALEAIAVGALQKVVLARPVVLPLPTPADPVAVLQALHRSQPRAYCFLFEPQPGMAFVGATPELLARVQHGQVETVALAGSIARGRNEHEDALLGRQLLQSAKDRREHAAVVTAIRKTLVPLTRGLAAPSQPRLRRLPHIQHLETPLRGLLRPGIGLLEVAAALHPTPALGGVPRATALDFIAAHEPYPRGWYAAPVGLMFPDGSGELGVAIRSALLLGDRAVLYAGAGIVAGSDPAREWQETTLKLETMRRALASALAFPQLQPAC